MLQLIKSLVPMATKSGSRIEILQQFCFCHPTLRQCPSTTTIQAMMLKQYLPIISIQAAHLCSTLHLFLYTIMNSISGPHLCPLQSISLPTISSTKGSATISLTFWPTRLFYTSLDVTLLPTKTNILVAYMHWSLTSLHRGI